MPPAAALTAPGELVAGARVGAPARRLAEYAGLFDDPDLINTLLPRYLAVTAEQVRDAAREVFRADNRVILTYVPAAAGDTAADGDTGAGGTGGTGGDASGGEAGDEEAA